MSVAVRSSSGRDQLGAIEPYEPISDDSKVIDLMRVKALRSRSGTALDWSSIIQSGLSEIFTDCRNRGWDGDDALAVPAEAIGLTATLAIELSRKVSAGIPAPDIIPEHDGEICLTWEAGGGRVYSASIGSHGKLNYSGQFGSQGSTYGWQPLRADIGGNVSAVAASIADKLKQLFDPSIGSSR